MRLMGIALGLAVVAGPAWAQNTIDSICLRREVLDLVERHFSRDVAHLDLVGDSASEIRVAGAWVLCGVDVRVAGPAIDGASPAVLVEPRYFQARSVNGGVEVDFGGR